MYLERLSKERFSFATVAWWSDLLICNTLNEEISAELESLIRICIVFLLYTNISIGHCRECRSFCTLSNARKTLRVISDCKVYYASYLDLSSYTHEM